MITYEYIVLECKLWKITSHWEPEVKPHLHLPDNIIV